MEKCDIIIPVYNALEYLKLCVDSIISYTDLTFHQLTIINDCSSDENIELYLNDLKERTKMLNVRIKTNKKNLGFVGTVNRGMKESINDVLLLNSDTEVSKNWLDNIIECAYSERDIATVTALSNNATLVSVPNGLQPNDLPNNVDFETYTKIIETCSYKSYPQLPTAHGFCMFIKRTILNEIGYFDEETFGKGYGEENDFSFRCLDYGYKNVLCDNVLVFHKESQSFSSEKDQFIKNNLVILEKRYPIYFKKNENWCEQYPLGYIGKNIDYSTNMYERKNVLFLVHDWNDVQNNVGGTTIHCLDLINAMRKDFNFHVLSPYKGMYKVHSYFKDSENEIELSGVYSSGIINYYNKNYSKMINSIIKGLNISVIHIHHMIGHYFDVANIAKENDVKLYITLHDFYCLCPTINMLYNSEVYCIPLKNKNCTECLRKKNGIQNDVINVWRNEWKIFLGLFDKIITPSSSTKDIIEKELGMSELVAIEHGINIEKHTKADRINENEEFNVAFLGVMAKHKGGHIVDYLIKNCKNKKIKFHLFGDSEFKCLKKKSSNYIYHGRYKRDELYNLMNENKIDLVCNLSIWPETYSYTLTETIACGIPVLSFEIGAVAERIHKYGFGWVLPVNSDSKDVLEFICSLSNDVNKYNTVLSELNLYKIKSITEMIENYDFLYQYNHFNEIPYYESLRKLIMDDYNEKVSGSSSELDRILNSRKWKLVSKIKVPEVIRNIGRK